MRTLIDYQPPAEPLSKQHNVIMSAATLFLRDGIAAVRMTDIADASGVGVATLYRHYKTKTAIAIHAGTLHFNATATGDNTNFVITDISAGSTGITLSKAKGPVKSRKNAFGSINPYGFLDGEIVDYQFCG